MLVSSLLPSTWVGSSGEWETAVGAAGYLRSMAVVVLCVGGPIAGLVLHGVGM
jgi:hypothetical protein